MGSLGFQEILLILAIGMLLFGPKKLPELGRALGKGIREFKKSTSGLMENLQIDLKEPIKEPNQLPIAQAVIPDAPDRMNDGNTKAVLSATKPVKPTVLDLEKESERP